MALTKNVGLLLILITIITISFLCFGYYYDQAIIRNIPKMTGFVFPEGTKIVTFRPRPFWEGRANWFDLFLVLPQNYNPTKTGLDFYRYDPAYTNDWAICYEKNMDHKKWDFQRQIFENSSDPLNFLGNNKKMRNTKVELGTNLYYCVSHTAKEGYLFLILIDTMNGNAWLRIYTGD